MTDTKDIILSDGKVLDSYIACAIIEQFCEGENYQNKEDILKAYSYIGINGLHRTLQGFYGRGLDMMVDNGFLDSEYKIIN